MINRSGRTVPLHPLIEWLRVERIVQNMNQSELGMAAGYDRETVSRWERASNKPGLFAFVDVLSVLGYNLTITKVNPDDAKHNQHSHHERGNSQSS